MFCTILVSGPELKTMTFRKKDGQRAPIPPDFDRLKPAPEPVIVTESGITTSAPPPSFVRFNGSILVIDDEPMIQKIAKRVLGKMGNQILLAGTGNEGLEILAREKDIALIILDYGLPDIRGSEVLSSIRKTNEVVKVIICSGYPAGYYGETNAANGWLGKPFTAQEAYNAVNSVFLAKEGDY